jgi:hypothetical protein
VHEALLAEIYQVQSAIGQMTGHSEVIQPLLSHVVFDGRASVPIKLSHSGVHPRASQAWSGPLN